jgi:hypothetical protein
MSTPILVLGKSGSGKSTSMRNLVPEETFLINVIGKQLPFKGGERKYQELKGTTGNRFTNDAYVAINKCIDYIDKDRPDIKNIVIDDSQYLIVNEFMRRHSLEGKGNDVFKLYNEIGDHFWNLVWKSRLLREDVTVFFLHHSERSDSGEAKAKTIGKILDEKVDICGMFTTVLFAHTDSEGHWFETNNNGLTPSKSPMGMFAGKIENDLQIVLNSIKKFNEEI